MIKPCSYTLKGLKALVKPQGVTSSDIDIAVKEMAWTAPVHRSVRIIPKHGKKKSWTPVKAPSAKQNVGLSLGDPLQMLPEPPMNQITSTVDSTPLLSNFMDLFGSDDGNPLNKPMYQPETVPVNPPSMDCSSGLPETVLAQAPAENLPPPNTSDSGLASVLDYWLLPTWANGYVTDRTRIGVVMPLERTEYFWGPNGERYLRFPAIWRMTGTVVLVIAPVQGHCPETILRDCPELGPYKPQFPETLPWTNQNLGGIPCSFSGLLYQDVTAGLDRISLT